MKLIDLDKAVSICDEDNNAVIFTNIKNVGVKAIPIEWIRNEIASSIKAVRDGDYDYTYASCILKLLEKWEKENETN